MIITGMAGAAFLMAAAANTQGNTTARADDTARGEEKICEDIIPVGTRLAVKRICATRTEWAEKRRRDRDMIDAAQRNRQCYTKETSTTSTTAC